jgi:serpin B
MVRFLPLLAVSLVLVSSGAAQAPVIVPPPSVINDPAWSSSASLLNLSSARTVRGTARLSNVSIRARAGTGADTLIAGAGIQGTGTLPVLVRAIGPGLAQFGVGGYLREPTLEVFRGTALAARNTTIGPGMAATSAYVGAFPPLDRSGAPGTNGDTALAGQIAAGTLTAHCSASAGTATGVALLEFYDAAATPSVAAARFVNLSSRARVAPGEGLIVVGFVISGEGSTTLLLRGVGSTLQTFGVTDTLRDPLIELYEGSMRIASNDNWQFQPAADLTTLEQARQAVGAFALTNSGDAALVVTLPAGSYTMQVRSASSESGIALAEIHEVARTEFAAATAANQVGLTLHRELARTRPGENLILSPYSLESSLALAYAGAAGTTREEMARVLALPADNAPLQAGFAALRDALQRVATNSQVLAAARTRSGAPTDPIEWQAANRLFAERDFEFREPFFALMREGFAAPLELLDFRFNFEPARLQINAWVEEQTRQKIRNLLPAGSLTDLTRLVLVNALYLKAPWATAFEKAVTAPRPFRLSSGATRNVPTMRRTGFLRYAAEDGFKVAALDYLGGELQFVIILPDEGRTLEATASQLTTAHLARWASSFVGFTELSLSLPKFKVEGSSLALKAPLVALGIPTAFDLPRGSANFDGIAPRRPDSYLAISNVYHQTFFAIDEEGTEAAAATGTVMVEPVSARPPPLEFRVDRPFLFALQHRASGTCLFFGSVHDPQ